MAAFSDFAVTDSDPDEALARLARFPGDVHAVVLGGHVPSALRGGGIAVTTLSRDDTPGTFAAALLRSLTATRRGARPSVVPGQPCQEGA